MCKKQENTDCPHNEEYSSDMAILRTVLSQARKPLIALAVYMAYSIYVNYYGVLAFFSISMFLIPLMLMTLFVWGLLVSFNFGSVDGTDAKLTKFIVGLIIAILPIAILHLGRDINEAGIARKFRKYDRQLMDMSERILDETPENIAVSLGKYKQFRVWSPGARPTRQYGYHKNGMVFLDFIGSPDNGSGVIYNPEHKKIEFHESNYYHMFGPWYRFDVNY